MKLKFLILEDSVHDAQLIEYQIVRNFKAAETSIVHKKEDFEREFEHWRPDFILSDYNLPDVNGEEVLRYVRLRNHDIPFIVRKQRQRCTHKKQH